MIEEFDIRYSTLSDESYLQDWLSSEEELQWFPFSEKECNAAVKNWIGFSRYKASLTATVKERPCGIATLFLMPYKRVAHQALFYLIVDPEFRRQGIGSSLLKNLLHLAENYFSLRSLFAEVFEGCFFLPLLEKQGFSLCARQKNYVKLQGKYKERIIYEYFFKENQKSLQ